MRSVVAVLGIALVIVGLTVPSTVFAFSSLLDQFRAEYPVVVGSKLDTCGVCHVSPSGGGVLNPYGSEVASNNLNLGAVENKDSDDDGFTNIEEINALTFPGDAGDFPAGGGSRVAGRGTLSTGVDALMASAATDTQSGKVLAVWTQVDDGGSRGPAATVHARLALADARETGKLANLGVGDGDKAVAVAYGAKAFLAAWWTGADVVARAVKASNAKPQKGPNTVAAGASDPAVAYDAGLKRFLVASSTSDGTQINQVDTKGKVTDRTAATDHILLPELGWPLAFAAGDSGDGLVLVGAEASGAKARPLGAQLIDGELASVSAGYGKFSTKGLQAAAAFGDASGVVTWRDGTTLLSAGLQDDGSLAGKALKQKGIAATMVAVAAQPDGNYLVVWTDAGDGTVMAADMDAAGKLIGDAFELQNTGETADPGVLAASAVRDGVLVVYATEGTSGQVRSVLVAPQ